MRRGKGVRITYVGWQVTPCDPIIRVQVFLRMR